MFHLKKNKICLQCRQLFSYVGVAREVKWQHPIDFCRNNLWLILLSAKPFQAFPSVFIWKSTHAFYHFYQLCQVLLSLCPHLVSVLTVGHLCPLRLRISQSWSPSDQRNFWSILMPAFCLLTYFPTKFKALCGAKNSKQWMLHSWAFFSS